MNLVLKMILLNIRNFVVVGFENFLYVVGVEKNFPVVAVAGAAAE